MRHKTMRPRGVTILAILWAIGSIIQIVSGISLSFVLPLLPGGGVGKAMSGNIIAMSVVSGIIGLVVAYGLWTLKNWARILAIFLCILGILGCAGWMYSLYAMQKIGVAQPQPAAGVIGYVFGGTVVVFALITWYLVRVKDAFA